MNRPVYALFYTLVGYPEATINGMESSAPYKNPTVITCQACHLPDNSTRAEDVKNACTDCQRLVVKMRLRISHGACNGYS